MRYLWIMHPRRLVTTQKYREWKGLARMDICTTDPHYPWKNKAESVIKIIKGKSNRRRVQRNIPKRVWDIGMVWEADIYYRAAGKDGHPDLERSTGDTTEIY